MFVQNIWKLNEGFSVLLTDFFSWFNVENESEMNEIVIFIAFKTEIIILNL